MKIAIISVSGGGGAGIAARRLHEGFLKNGHQSSFLTLKESAGNAIFSAEDYFQRQNIFARTFRKYLFRFKARKYIRQLARKLDNFSLFSIPFGEYPLHLHPVVKEADIINVHWVAGFVDFHSFMSKIDKPVVLTLHDTFLFTAGCHYPNRCLGYRQACENCPVVPVEVQPDVSVLFNEKQKAYLANTNIGVVGISKWMTEVAASSRLLKKRQHVTIHNGLDAELFPLYNRETLRKEFDLQHGRFYALMVGQDLNDPRKGSEFILPLLQHPQLNHVSFLLVGALTEVAASDRIIQYGSISDKDKLNKVYQAADVYVHLAIQDNFPNTVLEALFNGCPVAGFNIGGLPDMVEQGFNGSRSNEVSLEGIVNSILEVLGWRELDRKAVALRAQADFSVEKLVKGYLGFFSKVQMHDRKAANLN